MGYLDYKQLIEKADLLLENDTQSGNKMIINEDEWYLNKEQQALRWLCQCKNGHHFDYRNRVRYPVKDKTHAPCQGMCPECGSGSISMWSQKLYPTRFNFIGG